MLELNISKNITNSNPLNNNGNSINLNQNYYSVINNNDIYNDLIINNKNIEENLSAIGIREEKYKVKRRQKRGLKDFLHIKKTIVEQLEETQNKLKKYQEKSNKKRKYYDNFKIKQIERETWEISKEKERQAANLELWESAKIEASNAAEDLNRARAEVKAATSELSSVRLKETQIVGRQTVKTTRLVISKEKLWQTEEIARQAEWEKDEALKEKIQKEIIKSSKQANLETAVRVETSKNEILHTAKQATIEAETAMTREVAAKNTAWYAKLDADEAKERLLSARQWEATSESNVKKAKEDIEIATSELIRAEVRAKETANKASEAIKLAKQALKAVAEARKKVEELNDEESLIEDLNAVNEAEINDVRAEITEARTRLSLAREWEVISEKRVEETKTELKNAEEYQELKDTKAIKKWEEDYVIFKEQQQLFKNYQDKLKKFKEAKENLKKILEASKNEKELDQTTTQKIAVGEKELQEAEAELQEAEYKNSKEYFDRRTIRKEYIKNLSPNGRLETWEKLKFENSCCNNSRKKRSLNLSNCVPCPVESEEKPKPIEPKEESKAIKPKEEPKSIGPKEELKAIKPKEEPKPIELKSETNSWWVLCFLNLVEPNQNITLKPTTDNSFHIDSSSDEHAINGIKQWASGAVLLVEGKQNITVEKVSGTLGGCVGMVAGAEIGGAICTPIAPGLGTLICGFIGGAVGEILGVIVGSKVGKTVGEIPEKWSERIVNATEGINKRLNNIDNLKKNECNRKRKMNTCRRKRWDGNCW